MNGNERTPAVGVLLAILLTCALPGAATASADRAQVIVNVDMTADGQLVPHPTPGKPAYYVPVILGYHAAGEIVAGEKPPSRVEMLRQLGKSLAKEGYVLQALRPDAAKTVPSLILVFEWGYLNPQRTDFGEDQTAMGADSSTTLPHVIADFNQHEMLTLVAGDALYHDRQLSTSDWDKLREAAEEGRYYIIVSAYDFEASLHTERKLLWRARMSTERQGVWMDDVVPALVASGAPLFGRRLKGPQFATAPVREGHVKVGTPVVVEPGAGADPARQPTENPSERK